MPSTLADRKSSVTLAALGQRLTNNSKLCTTGHMLTHRCLYIQQQSSLQMCVCRAGATLTVFRLKVGDDVVERQRVLHQDGGLTADVKRAPRDIVTP